MKYDSNFWKHHNEVRKTPLEKKVLELFESKNVSTVHRLASYESPATFRKDLALAMNDKMKIGKPIEMKYSNSSLTYEQMQAAPYQPIFVKNINNADDFFLGSFSLTGSPYRIKLSDVFEYKE